jgi:hypothetical protein
LNEPELDQPREVRSCRRATGLVVPPRCKQSSGRTLPSHLALEHVEHRAEPRVLVGKTDGHQQRDGISLESGRAAQLA